MATNFPTSKDDFINPQPTDSVAVISHADQHADANDAIEALQTKVGIDGDTNEDSIDFKLSDILPTEKAVTSSHITTTSGVHGVTGDIVGTTDTQTLENKTLVDKTSTGTDDGTETLENKTLVDPEIDGDILLSGDIKDQSGNIKIKTPTVASAVNHVELKSSVTTEDAEINAQGTDTNIGLKIKAKGTGKIKVGTAELELPNVDGSANQVLSTNGSKVLSWQTPFVGSDVINESEIPTPQSDAVGKVVKLESDGRFSPEFLPVKPLQVQEFTTAGSHTWNKPSEGTFAIIEMIGGGGSGAVALGVGNNAVASGGSGGAYRRIVARLSDLNPTESVSVGAGGASVFRDTNGTASGSSGGATSFKDISVAGGGGGVASSSTASVSVTGGGGAIKPDSFGESGAGRGGASSPLASASNGSGGVQSGAGGGGSASGGGGVANGSGGVSILNGSVGGNGASSVSSGTVIATAGVRGAGGGGATCVGGSAKSATSGAGGDGVVRITII